jgi:hypothetical protein
VPLFWDVIRAPKRAMRLRMRFFARCLLTQKLGVGATLTLESLRVCQVSDFAGLTCHKSLNLGPIDAAFRLSYQSCHQTCPKA